MCLKIEVTCNIHGFVGLSEWNFCPHNIECFMSGRIMIPQDILAAGFSDQLQHKRWLLVLGVGLLMLHGHCNFLYLCSESISQVGTSCHLWQLFGWLHVRSVKLPQPLRVCAGVAQIILLPCGLLDNTTPCSFLLSLDQCIVNLRAEKGVEMLSWKYLYFSKSPQPSDPVLAMFSFYIFIALDELEEQHFNYQFEVFSQAVQNLFSYFIALR